MVSSTSELSVDVIRNLFIDRYSISTLSSFNVDLSVLFSNKSPQPVYIRAVLNDPAGNWTFSGGSTTKDYSIGGFGSTTQTITLTRAVPSADVEAEQFTLTFEIYKDSGHTQKIDQIVKTITAYIVDFRNNSNWTTDVSDFDDGTAQGWTLNLFSISDVASIEAGGYSAYYDHYGSTKYPSLEKDISVSSSPTGLIFYWGAYLTSANAYAYARLYYVRVYIDNVKVYEDHVNASVDYGHKSLGWYQVPIDLSSYVNKTIHVKIEFQVWTSGGGEHTRIAVDDILLVSKSS